MGPYSLAAVLFALGITLYFGYSYIKSRNLRLLREARRKKYAPDLPPLINTTTSTTMISQEEAEEEKHPPVERTVQIEELDEKQYDLWEKRDRERDQNIAELRLILDDIIGDLPEVTEPPTDDEKLQELESRNEWIIENEDDLEEHATFVEREQIGSGIIIEQAPPENDDLDLRLEREGGKSGYVQVTLGWDDYNDLDLHLFCPSGERIYFNNKTSDCGGELDVDMNIKPVSDNAVENVVWTSYPSKGTYKVGVHFYKHHNKKNTKKKTKYRLRVAIFGKVQEYTGMIKYGSAIQMVTGFTIGQKNELEKQYNNFD